MEPEQHGEAKPVPLTPEELVYLSQLSDLHLATSGDFFMATDTSWTFQPLTCTDGRGLIIFRPGPFHRAADRPRPFASNSRACGRLLRGVGCVVSLGRAGPALVDGG